jgi:hypothetical protein
MPGYEVIGFPWGNWYYYDALHCRTRAIFDRQMLRIKHRRLASWMPVAPEHEVTARIDDRSEAGLLAQQLRVYWRQKGTADWNWILFEPMAEPDRYAAAVPGQAPGTAVEYYVAAADATGRVESLPRTAPEGSYDFVVGCAPIALTVGHAELAWTGLAGATGYDVVRGDLHALRASGGEFLSSVDGCVVENHDDVSLSYAGGPGPHEGIWFLVRARSAAGVTSYGHTDDCERTTRDARIDAAAGACP